MILNDTICAISTAQGHGAVAMVRISGRNCFEIADKIIEFVSPNKRLGELPANTIHFVKIKTNERIIDEAMVAIFLAPHSYTGEDTLEITCHGSEYVQQKILELLIKNGARLATPGEFTLRAFLNGKLDLSQAEGVADLIASGSEAAHSLAINQMRGGFSDELSKLRSELLHFISLIELELDFSDEDVEFANRDQLNDLVDRIELFLRKLIKSFTYGNAIKNGIPVAIVGRTNAGKSTLLNQLLKEEKAIVSEIAGTTRDYIEDTIVLEGINFRFIDTAGLRKTSDEIETIGIERAMKKYREARIVIILIDARDSIEEIQKSLDFMRDIPNDKKHRIFAINKIDTVINPEALLKDLRQQIKIDAPYLAISAKHATHIDKLEQLLVNIVQQEKPAESGIVVTNLRHFQALQKSHEAILRVLESMENKLSSDLLAEDIREALHFIGEITGEITNDEILGSIFSKFCIGK